MLRFRIDHPRTDMHTQAGHDPVVGFFVDVLRRDHVIKSYDFFQARFNRSRPLMGCLDFLVSEGFFTGDELEDALVYLQDSAPVPSDMRIVEIVMEFKRAAD
jgi:hypothetical protein